MENESNIENNFEAAQDTEGNFYEIEFIPRVKLDFEIPTVSDDSEIAAESDTSKEEDSPKKFVIKKKLIAALLIGIGAVLLVVAAVISVFFINKVNAYNEGIQFVNSGNIKEAQVAFEKADDYSDASIYLVDTKAADQLYNNNNPEVALSTILELFDQGSNPANSLNCKDCESNRLTSFMLGEVYFAKTNYTNAEEYFSLIPVTYKAFNHSAYERRAFIQLIGTWNVNHSHTITDARGSHTADVNINYEFYADGTYKNPGFSKVYMPDKSGWSFWSAGGTGTWSVDTSSDGSDGVYHYIFNSNPSTTFTFNNNTLTWTNTTDKSQSTYTATKL